MLSYCERMLERLKGIAKAYGFEPEVGRVQRCFRGRMHQTWLVSNGDPDEDYKYLFQEINTGVFKHLNALMGNVSKVSHHLKKQLNDAGIEDMERRFLHLRHTLDDAAYFTEEDGSCWRIFDYVRNSQCLAVPENRGQAYEAARGYGRFLSLLADFPVEDLIETIPDFHNTAKRLSLFNRVVRADLVGRVKNAAADIAFIEEMSDFAHVLVTAHAEGLISQRAVHNDTKMSNVLLDQTTGEAICVIDLDTVMAGLSVNDFGDMARSMTCTKSEDDHDWDGTDIDMDLYQALVEGYLREAGGVLKRSEIDHFATAAMVLTYELGIRFLSDYLSGDIYFPIQGDDDNLDRARIQLELFRAMLRRRSEMEAAVGRKSF